MTRVIVAGSRGFNDYKRMRDVLDEYFKEVNDVVEIVEGDARGADRLSECYAQLNGYSCKVMPADWSRHGKSAGYIRNSAMADYAIADGCKGVLFAFWDGESRGTANMIEIANKKGLDVHVVLYEGS